MKNEGQEWRIKEWIMKDNNEEWRMKDKNEE